MNKKTNFSFLFFSFVFLISLSLVSSADYTITDDTTICIRPNSTTGWNTYTMNVQDFYDFFEGPLGCASSSVDSSHRIHLSCNPAFGGIISEYAYFDGCYTTSFIPYNVSMMSILSEGPYLIFQAGSGSASNYGNCHIDLQRKVSGVWPDATYEQVYTINNISQNSACELPSSPPTSSYAWDYDYSAYNPLIPHSPIQPVEPSLLYDSTNGVIDLWNSYYIGSKYVISYSNSTNAVNFSSLVNVTGLEMTGQGYGLPYVMKKDNVYYMFVINTSKAEGSMEVNVFNSTNKVYWTLACPNELTTGGYKKNSAIYYDSSRGLWEMLLEHGSAGNFYVDYWNSSNLCSGWTKYAQQFGEKASAPEIIKRGGDYIVYWNEYGGSSYSEISVSTGTNLNNLVKIGSFVINESVGPWADYFVSDVSIVLTPNGFPNKYYAYFVGVNQEDSHMSINLAYDGSNRTFDQVHNTTSPDLTKLSDLPNRSMIFTDSGMINWSFYFNNWYDICVLYHDPNNYSDLRPLCGGYNTAYADYFNLANGIVGTNENFTITSFQKNYSTLLSVFACDDSTIDSWCPMPYDSATCDVNRFYTDSSCVSSNFTLNINDSSSVFVTRNHPFDLYYSIPYLNTTSFSSNLHYFNYNHINITTYDLYDNTTNYTLACDLGSTYSASVNSNLLNYTLNCPFYDAYLDISAISPILGYSIVWINASNDYNSVLDYFIVYSGNYPQASADNETSVVSKLAELFPMHDNERWLKWTAIIIVLCFITLMLVIRVNLSGIVAFPMWLILTLAWFIVLFMAYVHYIPVSWAIVPPIVLLSLFFLIKYIGGND